MKNVQAEITGNLQEYETITSTEGYTSTFLNTENISQEIPFKYERVYEVDKDFSLSCNTSKVSNCEQRNFNLHMGSSDAKCSQGDFPADLKHEKRCEEYNSSSYSSSDSSDFSTDFENDFDKIEIPCFTAPSEIEQLREFGQRINQNDLDILLGILRPNLLPTLPKSAKTFLRTVDAEYNIIEMEDANNKPGQFVYFGIKQGLEACINPDLHKNEKIRLQMNVDGLPLSKSNNDHFWPILAKVFCEPDVYEVIAVAIYFGPSKPKSTEE